MLEHHGHCWNEQASKSSWDTRYKIRYIRHIYLLLSNISNKLVLGYRLLIQNTLIKWCIASPPHPVSTTPNSSHLPIQYNPQSRHIQHKPSTSPTFVISSYLSQYLPNNELKLTRTASSPGLSMFPISTSSIKYIFRNRFWVWSLSTYPSIYTFLG